VTCPDEEHWKESKNYCIQDFPDVVTGDSEGDPETTLDPRSIRSKKFEDNDGESHVIRVGCPEGEWDSNNANCEVGTVATQLLHPKSERQCDMTDDC